MGETGDSRRNLGLDGSVKNVIGPVNLGVILKRRPRPLNRVHSGLIWISLDTSSSLQMPGSVTVVISSVYSLLLGCQESSSLECREDSHCSYDPREIQFLFLYLACVSKTGIFQSDGTLLGIISSFSVFSHPLIWWNARMKISSAIQPHLFNCSSFHAESRRHCPVFAQVEPWDWLLCF
jgi:hypothetical protein